ncbi:MAG TPA: hypothetical protein PKO30_16920 [Prolixibacteraceae bacterium]|jgi:hypothetical protein|nr:hypothetical protein [Prolixibacteraceae bacterium]
MNRKEFFRGSLALGACAGCFLISTPATANSPETISEENEKYKALLQEKEFIQNWLSDLIETIDTELDQATKVKLLAGCGRGCFNRFKFKSNIAEQGKGDLNKLIEAYKHNFEVWKDGNQVHVRYGEVSKGCYCPAAKYRPAKPNDIHCECTRATHQTIFETALGRPIDVKILETVRRGDKTCHFVATV